MLPTPAGRRQDAPPRYSTQPFSVTVVFGWRAAVAGVTNRPVIAERDRVALPLLPPLSETEVRGLRAAALVVM